MFSEIEFIQISVNLLAAHTSHCPGMLQWVTVVFFSDRKHFEIFLFFVNLSWLKLQHLRSVKHSETILLRYDIVETSIRAHPLGRITTNLLHVLPGTFLTIQYQLVSLSNVILSATVEMMSTTWKCSKSSDMNCFHTVRCIFFKYERIELNLSCRYIDLINGN